MKYIFLFTVLITTFRSFSQTIVEPTGKGPTAFAIIIDKDTYDNTKPAVDAYKKMLEQKEHLSTYLIIKNWQNPEEVKAAIKAVAAKNPVLEGAVFIGHVPVALVRNAQHMTTAFKMDEIKYPIQQSSVASDRFYDDFDLRFRYLKKDEKNTGWFYYELEESSPQVISSDIYTARIMSHQDGPAQYEEISAFLRKAVNARKQPDHLDHLLAFTGGAYNSESLTAWADEKEALKELFPQTFKSVNTARMLNFRMEPQMKFRLFSELQRPELDIALLSEHGDISKQYINNSPSGDDADFSYNQLRYIARTTLRRAAQRGQDTAKIKALYKSKYNLDDSWFAGATGNDSLMKADSLVTANANILTPDLKIFTPQSKVIIFNSCYNGSFHHPENIAGAYIFSPGNTLLVQGNTTNVLQDKWALDQMGLLNKGVRAGLWASQSNTLESHLSGDPTWHFDTASDLNRRLVINKNNVAYWHSLLKTNDPILQSLALKQLFAADTRYLDQLLLQTFKSSPYANVRMQCLTLLSRIGGAAYSTLLPLALQDPYELIRRKAADWASKSGDETLIPHLVSLVLKAPNDERVVYNAHKCLGLMNAEKVKEEITQQLKKTGYIFNKEEFMTGWLEDVKEDSLRAAQLIATIEDRQRSEPERIQEIRMVRNNTYHYLIPRLLTVAEDSSESTGIRQNLIEALGWFSDSYQKPAIIAACQRIQQQANINILVNREATQTVLRLQKWNLQ